MSEGMRIKGVSYPHPGEGSKTRKQKTRSVRPTQFIWLAVLVVAVILVALFGTPHMRFKYQFSGSRAHPYYLSCEYVGLSVRNVQPVGGKCPLIMMFKSKSRGE